MENKFLASKSCIFVFLIAIILIACYVYSILYIKTDSMLTYILCITVLGIIVLISVYLAFISIAILYIDNQQIVLKRMFHKPIVINKEDIKQIKVTKVLFFKQINIYNYDKDSLEEKFNQKFNEDTLPCEEIYKNKKFKVIRIGYNNKILKLLNTFIETN